MVARILVAHARTPAALAEAAEVIADVFAEAGVLVDVRPANAVRSIAGYDSVVAVGSVTVWSVSLTVRCSRPSGPIICAVPVRWVNSSTTRAVRSTWLGT